MPYLRVYLLPYIRKKYRRHNLMRSWCNENGNTTLVYTTHVYSEALYSLSAGHPHISTLSIHGPHCFWNFATSRLLEACLYILWLGVIIHVLHECTKVKKSPIVNLPSHIIQQLQKEFVAHTMTDLGLITG